MKIDHEVMKKYHVKKISITRETIKPYPPYSWSPYEALVIRVEGDGKVWERGLDVKLCYVANPPEPVKFALFDTMQAFKGLVEHL